MQVDLSAIATEVEPKKRTYKKRKVEPVVEEIEEERPTKGGKSIKSLPVKEKKPPTEKQIAARERLKQARLEKIEKVKAEKARLDEEIRLKAEEVERKKAELAEKRRLKREEKKAAMPQLPVKTSEPGRTGDVEPPKPTISETLATVGTVSVKEKTGYYPCATEPVERSNVIDEPLKIGRPKTPPTEVIENPNLINVVTPRKIDTEFHAEASQEVHRNPPGAPKREYFQRFRTYPFGKSAPTAPRFR